MLKWLLPLFLLAAVPAAAQQGHEHHSGAKPSSAKQKTEPEYSRFTREMNAGMSTMMKDMHTPGYAGNPDIDFLAMMIPHHEGAVEMARLVLVHGRDPATRRLAEDIIASQVVEIEGMKRRLATLRANKETGADEFPALGGTRGPVK
jgi:uncharacterized protein (DUF305 family)